MDKLRDNIPKDAKEQLFGVTSLEEAWTILTQRYGDPLLIGRKLKAQLKNVQPTGENDPIGKYFTYGEPMGTKNI